MPDIDRSNLKCVECGARFAGKATGKIAIVCSAECRRQRQSRAQHDRREGSAPAPSTRAPAETPVLARTKPTPELAAALREPTPAAGPATWPYAVSIGGLAVAVRTADGLAELVERFGSGT